MEKLNIHSIYWMQSKNNKVIMAAAGAGKTWGICNNVINEVKNTNKKILIITYTNKGIEAIEKEYKKQNYGVIDNNVIVKTWFQFLLSELIKPYQNFVINDYNLIKSIDFSQTYGYINYAKRGNVKHYINKNNDILSNTVSELAIDINNNSKGKSIKRLEQIYSSIYVDEVQDLAGEDLSVLEILFDSNMHIECVGDYKQATYKTHNTKKNKKETGMNIINYFKELDKIGKINLEFNKKTRRFGTQICKFSNIIFGNLDDMIETNVEFQEENMGIYLLENKDVELYYKYYEPTVLKYDIKTDTRDYQSFNFGQCKGMTFNRVMIYPNGPYKQFLKSGTGLKSPCKYYVSATRARYSIVFVVDKIYENSIFKYDEININDKKIKVSKYQD